MLSIYAQMGGDLKCFLNIAEASGGICFPGSCSGREYKSAKKSWVMLPYVYEWVLSLQVRTKFISSCKHNTYLLQKNSSNPENQKNKK